MKASNSVQHWNIKTNSLRAWNVLKIYAYYISQKHFDADEQDIDYLKRNLKHMIQD